MSLKRMLGLGFGLAMTFGGTVGVGILRLPGTLVAALGSAHLVEIFWVIGGGYALLGAVSVAELAAMMPMAGGFYLYARRAFGGAAGFVVGWSDWINEVASLAYASMTAMTFLGTLWPPAAAHLQSGAIAILGGFTLLHCAGLAVGSGLTRLISVAVGVMMCTLVVACLRSAPTPPIAVPLTGTAVTLPLFSLAMLGAVVTALRAVFVTYDGWYSPIYLAEESTEPARMLPRALVAGTLIVTALYVIINVALLRVLPLAVIAQSPLPAADAARWVLPRGGERWVTIISLATVLSLVNAVMLIAPRILLAIGRDGLFTRKAAIVSRGGTPRVALLISTTAAAGLIVWGTFEQIIALAAVLFLLTYASAYAAVFRLRQREPDTPRPYRAFGYPWTTAAALVGCLSLLIAAVVDDPRTGFIALGLLALSVPVYVVLARRSTAVGPAAIVESANAEPSDA